MSYLWKQGQAACQPLLGYIKIYESEGSVYSQMKNKAKIYPAPEKLTLVYYSFGDKICLSFLKRKQKEKISIVDAFQNVLLWFRIVLCYRSQFLWTLSLLCHGVPTCATHPIKRKGQPGWYP